MDHRAGLGEPGRTALELLGPHADLVPEDLLGQPITVTVTVTVTMQLRDGQRYVNG